MIYVFVPLYPEAQPLLEKLGLKKKEIVHGFDSFAGESVILTITGTGSYSACAAVSSILAVCPPDQSDFMLVYGSCGSKEAHGLVQLKEIYDMDMERHAYPDLVFDLGIQEAGCISSHRIYTGAEEKKTVSGPAVHDMESYAMYDAGARHLGPHQMVFLRFVSDLNGQVTREDIQTASSQYADEVCRAIRILQKCAIPEEEKDESVLEAFIGHIHCSASMEAQVRQLIRYGRLVNLPVDDWMKQGMEADCKDRENGKKVLHALQERILKET